MEEWERRYLHFRDFRNAQCESIGEPIPKDKEYGTLKNIKGLFREFNGPEFWPRFEAAGHSSTEFERCKCKGRCPSG